MYRCNDCGREFETPDEHVLEVETGYTISACPDCGSDNILEVDDE
jgi:DNA-directed RNA polymerase subunit RPC12/RpoP